MENRDLLTLRKSSCAVDIIDCVFGIITFVLGYSYIKLMTTEWASSGIGFLIFTVLFTAVSLSYLYTKKKHIPKEALLYYTLTFLAVLPLGLYDENSFSWISTVLTMLLAVYSVTVACGVRMQDELGGFLFRDLYNSLFYRPMKSFGVQFYAVFMGGKDKSIRKTIVTVLLALFISIIVFFIAILMLSQVDDNFDKVAHVIISNVRLFLSDFSHIFAELPALFLALPVSLYLFAMFYTGVNTYKVSKYSAQEILDKRSKRKPVQEILFILPMIVLIFVYIVFFISHAMTLISVIHEGDILYSLYARQGFFELCQIAALNMLICLGTMTFCKKGEALSKILIVLNSIIAACTLILMITASIKLGLYVSMYGLTIKRIHAAWALFVIFAGFILLLIRQFKNYNSIKWASAILVISYIILSLCGISRIAVNYNIAKCINNETASLPYE